MYQTTKIHRKGEGKRPSTGVAQAQAPQLSPPPQRLHFSSSFPTPRVPLHPPGGRTNRSSKTRTQRNSTKFHGLFPPMSFQPRSAHVSFFDPASIAWIDAAEVPLLLRTRGLGFLFCGSVARFWTPNVATAESGDRAVAVIDRGSRPIGSWSLVGARR